MSLCCAVMMLKAKLVWITSPITMLLNVIVHWEPD